MSIDRSGFAEALARRVRASYSVGDDGAIAAMIDDVVERVFAELDLLGALEPAELPSVEPKNLPQVEIAGSNNPAELPRVESGETTDLSEPPTVASNNRPDLSESNEESNPATHPVSESHEPDAAEPSTANGPRLRIRYWVFVVPADPARSREVRGTFEIRGDAERMAGELRNQGLSAEIEERLVAETRMTRGRRPGRTRTQVEPAPHGHIVGIELMKYGEPWVNKNLQ